MSKISSSLDRNFVIQFESQQPLLSVIYRVYDENKASMDSGKHVFQQNKIIHWFKPYFKIEQKQPNNDCFRKLSRITKRTSLESFAWYFGQKANLRDSKSIINETINNANWKIHRILQLMVNSKQSKILYQFLYIALQRLRKIHPTAVRNIAKNIFLPNIEIQPKLTGSEKFILINIGIKILETVSNRLKELPNQNNQNETFLENCIFDIEEIIKQKQDVLLKLQSFFLQ